MKVLRALESFGRTSNDIDDRLPVSRSRCFDIGTWNGCGVNCPALIDGECDIPGEISPEDIIKEHGEDDSQIIFKLYDCFKECVK